MEYILLVIITCCMIFSLVTNIKTIKQNREIKDIQRLWTIMDKKVRPMYFYKLAHDKYPSGPKDDNNFPQFLKWFQYQIDKDFPFKTTGKQEMLDQLSYGNIVDIADYYVYVIYAKKKDANSQELQIYIDKINEEDNNCVARPKEEELKDPFADFSCGNEYDSPAEIQVDIDKARKNREIEKQNEELANKAREESKTEISNDSMEALAYTDWPEEKFDPFDESDIPTLDYEKKSEPNNYDYNEEIIDNQKQFFLGYHDKKDNETAEDTKQRIYENIIYKLTIAYGKTKEEILTSIFTGYAIDSFGLDKLEYYRFQGIKTQIERYWDKFDDIPSFVTSEIALIYLSNIPFIENESKFWNKLDSMAVSLSERILKYEFSQDEDNRFKYYQQFLTATLFGSNIDDDTIKKIIEHLPISIPINNYDKIITTNYDDAKKYYINYYGKKELEADEKNIKLFNSLPLDIEEIKKIFVYTGKGYLPYCKDEQKYINAIRIVKINLTKRVELGLSNINNVIPSGSSATTKKNTDEELILANLLLMPKYDNLNRAAILRIFEYKTKKTIIRHLLTDFEMPLTEAEEFCSFASE